MNSALKTNFEIENDKNLRRSRPQTLVSASLLFEYLQEMRVLQINLVSLRRFALQRYLQIQRNVTKGHERYSVSLGSLYRARKDERSVTHSIKQQM